VAGNNPRVILASTAGVYGNQSAEYYSEDLSISPVNHYSCSKASMEYMSRNYSDCADIVRVRPFNIIGVGQRSDFIVPKLVAAFAQRVPKLEVGNMNSLRDFIDVEYCADVLIKLTHAEAVPDILNICQGTAHCGNDLLQILGELTGFTPKMNVTSEFVRPNEVWRLVGDPTLLRNFMGKKSETTLREILLKMLEEY
jgi:nucleoside-diphosphate-sugar epimerase